MRQVNFDLDVLRSFVTGIELGSFSKAADRLGRSTSAVSAQLKKLEEQTGVPIFRKSGRGLALTEAGDTMLTYARRLLDLNDQAADAVRGVELEGWVRLGLQEDFSEVLLPEVLGRFARAHPKVRIEARVARNAELLKRIESGQLDMALAWGDGVGVPHAEQVTELPMCWVGPVAEHDPWPGRQSQPLPLVAFEMPCFFRGWATAALDRAGIDWRLAFTSPNLSGLWAATAAGLGITIRTTMGLPPTVRTLDPAEFGLPALPSAPLVLYRADAQAEPPAELLATIVLQSVRAYLHGRPGHAGAQRS
jgi:DNA-binding transcriptional LysR family regulator